MFQIEEQEMGVNLVSLRLMPGREVVGNEINGVGNEGGGKAS